MPDNKKSRAQGTETNRKVKVQRHTADLEQLATIGKLATKVAHELNGPLDGILRYINLAIRIIEQENLEKPKEYLTKCRQGLIRMVQIVSELLEFSRSTYALSETSVNIEQIINDAINAIETDMEISNIKILRDYDSQIPQVRNGNLFQVFRNLLKNAIDAMPDGGELKITTRLEKDSTIIIEFHDNGTGFAPEDAEAIFEPFYTTKNRGKGTGLGLTICKDIIERYNGRITAENAPRAGSIFTVYLPSEKQVEKAGKK